jgi:DNA-binding transcriptional LysR family regulator
VHDVRVGAFISAGAVVLPRALRALRSQRPDIRVTTREGTTPALVRALRAGTLDLAVISSRPPHRAPDAELPALVTEMIDETGLVLAAPESGQFAGRTTVTIDELDGVDWIASPSTGGEPLMGVWPGVAGRPRIVHTARDWMTKLQLVAAGCGMTTVPPNLAEVLPDGVRLLRVHGGPDERRRVHVARLPGRPSRVVVAVIDALRGGYTS